MSLNHPILIQIMSGDSVINCNCPPDTRESIQYRATVIYHTKYGFTLRFCNRVKLNDKKKLFSLTN